jgi:HPt (histidine-containing phosphotransfer) domain-containing protein
LKSSSSNIGAVKISEVCTTLEQISLEKNTSVANNLIEILEKSAKSIFAEFNKYTQ